MEPINDNNRHTVQGVLINGVYWADRNVNTPGTFTASPETSGKLYQWNRKKAFSQTYDIPTTWDNSIPEGKTWKIFNDPSPDGWRIPTDKELHSLLDTEKVAREQIVLNGITGIQFTDKSSGASIFLPETGYRAGGDGFNFTSQGFYWSTSPAMAAASLWTSSESSLAHVLYFDKESQKIIYKNRNNAYAIRCVRDDSRIKHKKDTNPLTNPAPTTDIIEDIETISIHEELTTSQLIESRKQILKTIIQEITKQAIFVLDRNHFGLLPENYEYYKICSTYTGDKFTNYVILPRFIINLMDTFPDIKNILAYHAYEISDYFPEKEEPARSYLYDTCKWELPAQLPERVKREIRNIQSKVPEWLTKSKATQVNSTILRLFLKLEKQSDGKVYYDELEQASNLKSFKTNFRSMDRIIGPNHGNAKIFQVEQEDCRQRVYLWCHAEEIIRFYQGPDSTSSAKELLKWL